LEAAGVSSPISPGQDSGAKGSDASSPRTSALNDLGQHLKQAREAQGIEPEALADRLRIGVEQLQALESADIGRLPETVFVIAQARRVAAALKLDVEPQLAAVRAIGDGGPARPRLPKRFASAGVNQQKRGPRHLPLSLLVLLPASAALLWAGQRLLQPMHPPAPKPALPMTTPGAPPRPAAAAAGTAAAARTLMLEGSPPSWVEVRRPDGATLFQGLLEGTHRFPLDNGLEVLAGRPDLVRAGIGPSPSRPLGPISDVRWRRFVPSR
jgi:hypothetical protein